VWQQRAARRRSQHGKQQRKVTLHLGYFATSPTRRRWSGCQDGEFATALGATSREDQSLQRRTGRGRALLSKSIDASFVGRTRPSRLRQSKGAAIRIVAGTASGGAFFIVNKEHQERGRPQGKKVGSPSLGNTQDVALRYWLKQQGLSTNTRRR